VKLYTGVELHSSNTYIGIEDESGKRIFKRKLPNDRVLILETLKPYNYDIVGIVVESTNNCTGW
jgi:transposase